MHQQSSLGGSVSVANPNDQSVPGYDEVLTELVDDLTFQTLLNQEGEIEVSNITYKVTPYGTFFTPTNNEAAIQNVLVGVAQQNDYTLRLNDLTSELNLTGIQVGNIEQNNAETLINGVYFIDSFVEENIPNPPTITYQLSNINNFSIQDDPDLNDPAYQNLAEYPLSFDRGWLGLASLTQTIFKNSTRYNNFDSKHRISTLLYSRNWGLLKTLGVKVKFQKKGWLWWNKTNTEEIRGGWDYIAYNSAKTLPAIILPDNEMLPPFGSPYLVNYYKETYYATPWQRTEYNNRHNLYGFDIGVRKNELFTISIPGWLVPFHPDGVKVPAGIYKAAIKLSWTELKKILKKSAPPTNFVSLTNSYPDNYKFPVYSLNKNQEGVIRYLSINDMENMPKSYVSRINKSDVLKDGKIQTFISPYEERVYNNDNIDIPLDVSTVDIKISTDVNKVLKSLLTEELFDSFEVKAASVFGAVKYNGQWRGIRLNVERNN